MIIITKFKRVVNITKRNIKKFIKFFDKNVYFSLGENCLSDSILARFGLKSFSSPYSFGRSNIEYLLNFEKESFVSFLDSDYLKYEYVDDRKVVRNKRYLRTENKYNPFCENGFEFTHHDVIKDKKERNRIRKRCRRLMKLRNKKIIMLYHHRFCTETDENLLVTHLSQFAELYEKRNNNVQIYCFSQVIVTDTSQRRVEHHSSFGIEIYKFFTLHEWAGNNEDIFWARCDDDLIKTMIDDMKHNSK